MAWRVTSPTPRRVLIVGGGVSGLSLAHFLSKVSPQTQVVLAEQGNAVGGWMKTKKIEGEQGVYLFEQGPRSIFARPTAVCAMALSFELGLKTIFSNTLAKRRFILKGWKRVHFYFFPRKIMSTPLCSPPCPLNSFSAYTSCRCRPFPIPRHLWACLFDQMV